MPPTCLQIGVTLGFVLTNGILQLVPVQSSPQKVQGLSCSCTLETKLTLRNFLATGGCFGCSTDRAMVLGWLKKEEESTLLLLQAGSISCSIYI